MSASASAKLTPAQKLFTQKLLASTQVSHSIKVTLKKGGFVSPDVLFADLTGDGKEDAAVTVDSGGSQGVIALYVFSAGADGKNLQVVYRNQRLYRGSAKLVASSLVYDAPVYKDGDELCCPSSYSETTLKWSTKQKRFGIGSRRTVASP